MERLGLIEEMGFQIAHELRNPMTIIGGYARSALKKTSPQDINYKNLQIIASEIERMEYLLNDFLDYLDSYQNKFEPVNLNQVMDNTLELHTKEIKDKKLSLEKNLQPGLPELYLNPRLLSSSIENLVKYLIFNTGPGGCLKVTTQLSKSEITLSLNLLHSSTIPEKLRNTFLLSTIIQKLGGRIKDQIKGKDGFLLELRFPLKGGSDGKHFNSGR